MHYDIVICGGGLVGRSLAIALAKLPLQIAIIEAQPPTLTHQADFDTRSFALTYSNALFLKHIGVWEHLAPTVTSIKTIHVSDRGHAGITQLTAQEQHISALGFIALAPDLNQALHQCVISHSNITLLCPASLIGLQQNPEQVSLTLSQDEQELQLTAKLVVAADGTRSTIRQLLNIAVTEYAYQQTAIIANIGLARDHNNIAYERFTNHGPIALLPLPKQRAGLVWTVPPEQVETYLNLPDLQFLAELQKAFGYRLGRFTKVGKRFAYPLQLLQTQELVKSRVVLVGNAAHTLHPIAGQGFNLGLRDVMVLSKLIEQAVENQSDIAAEKVLVNYALQQKQDHQRYIRLTDSLVNIFANSLLPFTISRNLGLNLLNVLPRLKKLFTRRMMGMGK